jgi:hypothetical protein
MTNLNAQRPAMTTPEDRPQTDIAMSDLDRLRVGWSRGQDHVITAPKTHFNGGVLGNGG